MPKHLWNRSWSSLWRLLGFFRHVNDRRLGGGTMDGPLRRVIDAPMQGGPRDWLRLHTHTHTYTREREREREGDIMRACVYNNSENVMSHIFPCFFLSSSLNFFRVGIWIWNFGICRLLSWLDWLVSECDVIHPRTRKIRQSTWPAFEKEGNSLRRRARHVSSMKNHLLSFCETVADEKVRNYRSLRWWTWCVWTWTRCHFTRHLWVCLLFCGPLFLFFYFSSYYELRTDEWRWVQTVETAQGRPFFLLFFFFREVFS